MNIAVIGLGKLGLPTAACLAEAFKDVDDAHIYGVDSVSACVDRLNNGECPVDEPGLSELLAQKVVQARLTFTTDGGAAVRHGEVIFIAVGTPPRPDGSADLSFVREVAREMTVKAGQKCTAIRRVIVPAPQIDAVEAYLPVVEIVETT